LHERKSMIPPTLINLRSAKTDETPCQDCIEYSPAGESRYFGKCERYDLQVNENQTCDRVTKLNGVE
jgi:hypothetical protein